MRITQDNVDPAGALKGNDGADVDQNNVAEEGDDVRADIEIISTGSGNDVINAEFPAANAVAADNTFNGGSNNDTIRGGVGEDRLNGQAGNDILYGGQGSDQMYGEAGADDFHALDTFWSDYIDGGFDADVDEVKNSDAFDEQVRIPN